MRTAMIIFVLPALQALAELFARPELRASIELVRIRSMAALDLPVAFGAPPRDPPVQDADIVQVPGEVGAELGSRGRSESAGSPSAGADGPRR
jgi:hypothetical protein